MSDETRPLARATGVPEAPAADALAPSSSGTRRLPTRFVTGCLVAGAVAVLVVLAGSAGLVWAIDRTAESLNPFDGPLVEERTIDRSGPAVLTAVTDLGELRAASGYYEVVIDLETETNPLPSFLVGERVLFVAAGSVDATVDLASLEDGDVSVEGETARLELPAPRLDDPRLDLERSYVVTRDRGIVNRVEDALASEATDEEAQELYLLAEERMAEAAGETTEITDRARENTRSTLTALLLSLGFTDVSVSFAGE